MLNCIIVRRSLLHGAIFYEQRLAVSNLEGGTHMTRMLDPRIKVVALLFVNLLMYSSITYWVEAICVLLITLGLLYQQQYKDVSISLTGYAVIAALTFLMGIIGGEAAVAIGAFLLLIRKMFPVFMAAKLLIHSPSGQLICGLQKWHCPKVLIVSVAVILRFFPTIAEEFRSIKNAMLVRGIPLNIKIVYYTPQPQQNLF